MARLRKGMWVHSPGGLGILVDWVQGVSITEPHKAPVEVHLVDADGNTRAAQIYPESSVTQAAHDDIPERRRPDPSVSKAGGYL